MPLRFTHRLHVAGADIDCRVALAQSFLQRLRGLLGHPPLRAGQALWLAQCSSIHTLGMGYPIDVVFLNRAGQVTKVCAAVPPLAARGSLGAASALEFRAGEAALFGIQPGMHVAWTN
ncbi:DUF192 domain-containing protein [Ralstonia solanacearum species complex bacterium KE056]|uniref:DUF192 domain-containing protein n=1 Tax=Ralstonia solanacearum species complex bacterium KE056 TaxID=3119585 RepID=UPI002FC30FB1